MWSVLTLCVKSSGNSVAGGAWDQSTNDIDKLWGCPLSSSLLTHTPYHMTNTLRANDIQHQTLDIWHQTHEQSSSDLAPMHICLWFARNGAQDCEQWSGGQLCKGRWLDGLKALFCGSLVTLCGVSVRAAHCITALFAIQSVRRNKCAMLQCGRWQWQLSKVKESAINWSMEKW